MAREIKLVADVRSTTGSGASRRLRRGGYFPGVVYGVGKPPMNVQVNEKAFRHATQGHTAEHVMIDLEIPGVETKKVLLQEVQVHPISGQILHADFHEISMTEKLRIEIAVHLVGEPIGVTQYGGVLEHLVRSIEVECLPSDIVDAFEVDVSGLRIGDSLTAGDIKLDPTKYTLKTDPSLAIAAVSAPRVEEEAAAASGEGAAEPVVIKEKKEDSEAAEGAKKEEKTAPAKEKAASAKEAKK